MLWKHISHLSSYYYNKQLAQKKAEGITFLKRVAKTNSSLPRKLVCVITIDRNEPHYIFIICHVEIIKQLVYEPLN